jgi:hypothetical protein
MADPQMLNFLTILNNPLYFSLFLLLIIWELVWKGIALWKAARNGQKYWFLAILIINTFGILEIAYIFYFSNNKEQKLNT